ncbi:MAG TPA: carbohydrate ABC transporter permease [Lachnospiraceae bacterium]|nr:carbohydrate ABC transporter permease [Lachnospiraceae bacterium]
MTKTKKRFKPSSVITAILVAFWFVVCLIPFVFMIMCTLKNQKQLMKFGVFSLPKSFDLSNYVEVFTGNIWHYFLNSVIVMAVTLVILLLFSAFAAYPLSRWKFKLNKPIYALVVACMSVPIHVTLLPIFMMAVGTGLYDSIWALVGPYVAFNLPISVFILVTFMASIPKELEEAADIDGCGRYGRFWKIMLPLSKPGLSTLVIYDGVNIWNEFSFALTLTQTSANRTLPLAVNEFQGQYSMNIPMIMTVLFVSILPMIIVYIFTKDKLIEGMMAGAVKG